jgi:elongation factor Ts
MTAVCDVWDAHLEEGRKLADPRAFATKAFEELLERADVDAVVIGTPDHWHVPMTVAACQAGKDVYVEKPLTHKLSEGEAVIEAQNRHERIVQVGTQQRSMPQFQRALELVKEGYIGHYLHHNGKLAVLVELNCETDFVARTDDFKGLARSVAEHIAAAAPIAVDRDQVPPDRVTQERRIFEEQVRESGKPEAMIEKIVTGKLEAFYKDVALMHQAWVRDPNKTIGDLVKEVAAKTGENVQVRRFVRFQLGGE